MELKVALKKLQGAPDFKKWHQKNKNTYFSYAFKIPQEMPQNEWQLGFYNNKNDRITTFVVKDGSVGVRDEEEIFKREEAKVNEVDIEKIKLDFDDAITKANEFQSRNYPKDRSIKTIAILQNIATFGNIWNITYITEAFNTLNMKIDASTGKMIEHNLSSIFSFRKE